MENLPAISNGFVSAPYTNPLPYFNWGLHLGGYEPFLNSNPPLSTLGNF